MNKWNKLASKTQINKTVKNLTVNGFTVIVVDSAKKAKTKVLELIPKNSEVMTMSSETLRLSGITKVINESGKFDSVKVKLSKMNRETDSLEMQKIGGAAEYTLGSVHAVTEDGHVIIASNTGSQLGAYAYGSPHVIWVVGTQKIVKNNKEGIKRIYDYVLGLESKRLFKEHGVKSNVSKLLIIDKEINPNRLTLILVKERVGF